MTPAIHRVRKFLCDASGAVVPIHKLTGQGLIMAFPRGEIVIVMIKGGVKTTVVFWHPGDIVEGAVQFC